MSFHTELVFEFEATLVLGGLFGDGYLITCKATPLNSLPCGKHQAHQWHLLIARRWIFGHMICGIYYGMA